MPSALRLPPRARPALVSSAIAVVTAAAALRHMHDALWQDEVASAWIMQQPTLTAALHRVGQTESTPPLWYVLAWLAHHAGLSVVGVRLISIALMSLAAALVVVLARRIVSLPLAAVAGLLVALGSEFASHAHELRSYALLTLLVVLFALALSAEAARPGRRREAALGGCVAAGLLTHYFFAFSLAAALVWLWLEPSVRSIRRRATVAIAAGLVPVAAMLPLTLEEYHRDHFWWIGRFTFREVLATPFRLFSPLFTRGTAHELAPPLFAAAVLVGAVVVARRSAAGRLYAALAFGPLVAAAAVWWLGVDVFTFRNLIGIGPFVALVVVGSLGTLRRPVAIAAAALLAAAMLGAYTWTQRATATPYDAIARTLAASGWEPSAPIAVVGNFFAFRSPLGWYLPRRPPLALAHPTRTRCSSVFLVERRRTGRFSVARLEDPLWRTAMLRHAVLLADPRDAPRCVRPSTRGLFAAQAP